MKPFTMQLRYNRYRIIAGTMEKIKVCVKSLRASRIKMFYDLVLQEEQGNRAVNISIGENEADNIAVYIDRLQTVRPLIYDVFCNTLQLFGLSLKEVMITDFYDGTYTASAVFSNGTQTQTLDIRPSDAVNLALRSNSPLYVSENVMQQTGFDYTAYYNENIGKQMQSDIENIDNLSIFGVNMLQDLLKDALDKEDYITASLLRDKINDLEQNGQQ